MVSVFVFLRYADNEFVRVLAVLVGALDLAYFAVLIARRRADPLPSP